MLNNLVLPDGSSPSRNQNKVVITLINLDAENNRQFYGGKIAQDTNVLRMNPAIRFNLSTLFSSNFDNYEEALKFLTATITFFQAHNYLDSQSSPSMPDGIDKLQFDVESTDSFQTHNLWSSMGAKYIPSILYRIRHINIQAEQIDGSDQLITNPVAEVYAK